MMTSRIRGSEVLELYSHGVEIVLRCAPAPFHISEGNLSGCLGISGGCFALHKHIFNFIYLLFNLDKDFMIDDRPSGHMS